MDIKYCVLDCPHMIKVKGGGLRCLGKAGSWRLGPSPGRPTRHVNCPLTETAKGETMKEGKERLGGLKKGPLDSPRPDPPKAQTPVKDHMNDLDRKATQMFLLRDLLIGRCGQNLTADLIDEISEELKEEITSGSCAWAFKPETQASIELEVLTAFFYDLVKAIPAGVINCALCNSIFESTEDEIVVIDYCDEHLRAYAESCAQQLISNRTKYTRKQLKAMEFEHTASCEDKPNGG